MIKKFLLPLVDKSFSFLANGPLQIVAGRRLRRREAPSSNLQNPDWRRRQDSNLHVFADTCFQDRGATVAQLLQ